MRVSEQLHKDGTAEPATTLDEQARQIQEIVAAVRTALVDRPKADLALLTKATSRLRQIPSGIETNAQFEALQGICRFFLGQDRDLPFAMEAGQYMVRLARGLGRKQELLNGLFIQAIIASQLDNHIEAVEACAHARELAIELGSAVSELKAVLNGAAVYINVGHYQWALDLLRTALTIADRCSEEDAARYEWLVLGNIAQCHLFLANFDEGLRTAQASRALAPEPTDPFIAGNRASIEFACLRLMFAQGRAAESRPILDAMAKYVEQAGSARARIDLSIARGLVEVAEGKREVGFSRIAAAREKANLIPSTLPDVLNASRAAYVSQGMREEARQVEAELKALLANRQETARLRAALVLGPVGTAGPSTRVTEYDRRLDAARERLLRSDSA